MTSAAYLIALVVPNTPKVAAQNPCHHHAIQSALIPTLEPSFPIGPQFVGEQQLLGPPDAHGLLPKDEEISSPSLRCPTQSPMQDLALKRGAGVQYRWYANVNMPASSGLEEIEVDSRWEKVIMYLYATRCAKCNKIRHGTCCTAYCCVHLPDDGTCSPG